MWAKTQKTTPAIISIPNATTISMNLSQSDSTFFTSLKPAQTTLHNTMRTDTASDPTCGTCACKPRHQPWTRSHNPCSWAHSWSVVWTIAPLKRHDSKTAWFLNRNIYGERNFTIVEVKQRYPEIYDVCDCSRKRAPRIWKERGRETVVNQWRKLYSFTLFFGKR